MIVRDGLVVDALWSWDLTEFGPQLFDVAGTDPRPKHQRRMDRRPARRGEGRPRRCFGQMTGGGRGGDAET